MNVLLIEDSAGDALLIDSAFENFGIDYKLNVKTDGKEAIEYIAHTDSLTDTDGMLPNMVILDLNLPYVDGFNILQKLKSSIRLNNIPVIIFSSSSEENDKKRAFQLGASAYFTKPIEYDQYMSTVESFLSAIG